ncbi:MAG TPA: phosphoenolpyruvate carboxykinase (ATP) [Chthonomonadaceae bacterium]|nr:phosphoenolpyruvate carboxykinase (ATP) [Chthonomonadaceae bacterium]
MAHLEVPLHQEVLQHLGLYGVGNIHHNLEVSTLIEHAIRQGEGALAHNGALVVRTGKFTGRSPKDKYIVQDPSSQDHIWWGSVNQPLSEEAFERLQRRMTDYLRGREVYVQDLYGGADSRYRLPVQVITEFAWHSLFAKQLLVRPDLFPDGSLLALTASLLPQGAGFTILAAPGCQAVPDDDGTNSSTFIAIHFGRRLVLIGGTEYAGEIKKSVFTVLNYLLPQFGMLPMHCSANIGRQHGDTALFFGLSGTGKTTLSADPHRDLIGDDEHGWSHDGVFNFEGGCYAKCIRLCEEAEPEIWSAIRFGTVLENVVMDPETRKLDFDSDTLTENTRAAYPIPYIPGARIPGMGGHPRNVVFLTADAFGVLPPISRLTPAQARFHFLSGYTAKIAGTERNLGKEPQATFSACFGQPFLPMHPTVYAHLLGEKLTEHNATVWLVNTGWSGGPYGVGQRMNIVYTRAMLQAALDGDLDHVEYHTDPVFGLQMPTAVPGVPSEVLNPRQTWADRAAYDAQAQHLARLFVENFEKYKSEAAPEVLAAAPQG